MALAARELIYSTKPDRMPYWREDENVPPAFNFDDNMRLFPQRVCMGRRRPPNHRREVADTLIAGTPAAAHVHDLLGDETLSTASVWADLVKGRKDQTPEMVEFKTANPNHSVFHYTDIPFEEAKYRDNSIGATNVDVVHAIPACILILQGKPEAANTLFTNVTPRVALRLLAHYIEDIHLSRCMLAQDTLTRLISSIPTATAVILRTIKAPIAWCSAAPTNFISIGMSP